MIRNFMFCHVSSPSCSSFVSSFISPLISLSPPFLLIPCCHPVQSPLCVFPSHCIWFYLAVLGSPLLLLKGVGSFLEYPPFWGLGWRMLMLSLCLHAAGGILQLFWLRGGEPVTRAGTLLPNPEVSAQQGTSKVTWKRKM